MKKVFIYSLLIIFLCGCSERLRTLIGLSGEQAAQRKDIKSQRNKFRSLLTDAENKKLKPGLSSKQIVALYGEPIAIKDNQGKKVFLYREPLDFNPAKKVYLFFDEKGILTNFEVQERNPVEHATN